MQFTDSQSDLADVVVRAIRVQLSHSDHQLLTVRYELASSEAVDQRPLLVDFSMCPLWPISLTGSDVNPIRFDEDESAPQGRVFLQPRANTKWKEFAEITVELKWKTRGPQTPLLGQPYLYLPAELPQVGKRTILGSAPASQPLLHLQGHLQNSLVGAQSHLLGDVVGDQRQLLRGVLCTKPSIRFNDERDRVQVCMIGDVTMRLSIASRRQIRSTIGQMCRFFGDQLHAPSSLRIAAALDSDDNARSVPGPLLTQSINRFRLPERNQDGHEFPIAREIAANWWGTGVRVEGADGVYLSGGIAFGLGLLWARSHAPKPWFNEVLQYYADRMVDSAKFKHIPFRPGERTAGIGFIVYLALASNPRLWTVLQQLTTEFWSCYVPDQVVLAGLRKGGFPIEDFADKRFLRDDQS